MNRPIVWTTPDCSLLTRVRELRSVVRGLLVALVLAFGSVESSSAAQIQLDSFTFGNARAVGDLVDVTARITVGDQEGPGTVDVVLSWGAERIDPSIALSALVLQMPPSIPTLSSPDRSIQMGSDCLAGVGAMVGTCSLSMTFHQPTQAGIYRLGSFQFNYLWVPEPGYELCWLPGYDGCVAAYQSVTVIAQANGLGSESSPFALWTSTLGFPGVRPIPEPGTATLVAIGLGLLCTRTTRRPIQPPQPGTYGRRAYRMACVESSSA